MLSNAQNGYTLGEVQFELVIGDATYPLSESDASWLAHAVRKTAVDAAGRAWDAEARAALQVAEVIHEGVERRYSPEPIELGRSHVHGLLAYAFHDHGAVDVYAHIASSNGLAALYLGLRRDVGTSQPRRGSGAEAGAGPTPPSFGAGPADVEERSTVGRPPRRDE